VLLGVDLVDAHHHQLGDLFRIADGAAGFGGALGLEVVRRCDGDLSGILLFSGAAVLFMVGSVVPG